MALRDVFDRVRDSVSEMTHRFLHGDNQGYGQPGYGQPDAYYDQAQQMPYGQENQAYGSQYEGAYQQPAYQQAPPPQQPYQAQAYQQEAYPPQEAAYQSPYAGSFANQAQQQPRAGRAARQAEKVVPFPGMMSDGAGNAYAHELQILQLRDRDECRAVIEHLKNNCTVALNMDNIASDTEKQRCVDMLSGAAYTLNCNISRISTRGVYLISPESVRVQQDESTRRLNGAARQGAQRASRAHSYASGRNAQEGYDGQEGGFGGYQPQGDYGYEPAPQGYQPQYGDEGEYRTAGYYGQETRRAAGYGR